MKISFVDCTKSPDLFMWVQMRNSYASCPVFNFWSLLLYGTRLDGFIPIPPVARLMQQQVVEDGNSLNFDMAYANQLLSVPQSWVDLMQVMGAFQFAPEVIILTDYENENSVCVVDSLIKFIQQRYSVNSYVMKDVIDIDPYATSDFETQQGYYNFINDIDRFKKMYSTPQQVSAEVFDVVDNTKGSIYGQ